MHLSRSSASGNKQREKNVQLSTRMTVLSNIKVVLMKPNNQYLQINALITNVFTQKIRISKVTMTEHVDWEKSKVVIFSMPKISPCRSHFLLLTSTKMSRKIIMKTLWHANQAIQELDPSWLPVKMATSLLLSTQTATATLLIKNFAGSKSEKKQVSKTAKLNSSDVVKKLINVIPNIRGSVTATLTQRNGTWWNQN